MVVTYSSGPPPAAVPDVVGETLSQARTAPPAGRGFTVKRRPGRHSTQRPGPCSRSHRRSGKAPQGSTVTLTVAKPLPNVTVPYLLGMTAADAGAALGKLGLTPIAVDVVKHVNPQNNGLVIRSSPVAGSSVPPETPVIDPRRAVRGADAADGPERPTSAPRLGPSRRPPARASDPTTGSTGATGAT